MEFFFLKKGLTLYLMRVIVPPWPTINDIFDDAIGQESVKRTLSIYIDAYKKTDRLPFINLTTGKGGGKTYFARLFREALQRKNGKKPPMLEVNGKTIKNATSFL